VTSGNRHRLSESRQAVSLSETSQAGRYYHHYHLKSPICIDLPQIPCELDGSIVLLDKAGADKNRPDDAMSKDFVCNNYHTTTILPPNFRSIHRRILTKVVVVVKMKLFIFVFEKKNEL